MYVATFGNASRLNETSRSDAVSDLTTFDFRHGVTCGASTVRFQSSRTISGVCSTCASLSNSMPACFQSVSATPIRTRSDCFGWKLAQPVPELTSGFFDPPVQPVEEPRSAFFRTAACAAACPAEVRWTFSLSASAAPAATSAAIDACKAAQPALCGEAVSSPLSSSLSERYRPRRGPT